ncbi:5'-3' exonuclease [Mycoplasma zalophi]|uniref:5'-3' exonuclease n=1 Tax=Mycoplasma zalophi TaxID=191287 RepID=A0ABS6DQ99_9MOLU|nr:5'-3' exonuclease H3TH domain-containing protein [Mycoplasma zalophi]MBU4690800.1 hypothetical protein [Mycoplasma zalophi]MBU4692384.1 hypothetical protein [Mycoplasma zalophi]
MKKRVIIIDGTYLVFKSYYGTLYSKLKLETTTGIKTNAIVGFFNTVFKLLKEYSPDQVFFCFDARAKTFRHEEYPEYKQQRQKAPEDFYTQLLIIKDLLPELNFKSFEQNGFEADDIVATITSQLKENTEILIYSADQDLNQLIDINVKILKPKNRELIEITNDNFFEIYNFYPWQVVDYKSIVGDSSDNFKGVKGIGPKTAIKLLDKYHNVENIYVNIQSLDKNIQKKFLEYQNDLKRDKYLAQLRYDVPFEDKNILNSFLNVKISENAQNRLQELELVKITQNLKKLEVI